MYLHVFILFLASLAVACPTKSESVISSSNLNHLHFTRTCTLVIIGERLYRSLNRGDTWEQVTFQQNNRIHTITVANDNSHVIIIGQNDNVWTSLDGGLNFVFKRTPGSYHFTQVYINNFNNSWVIGILHQDHCRGSENCSYDMYLTNDFGSYWQLIRKYVWSHQWLGDAESPLRVVIYEDTVKTGNQNTPSESVLSVALSPLILGFKTVVRNVTSFSVSHEKIFVTRNDKAGPGLGLYMSDDKGRTFRVAKTPHKLHGTRYTVLDASPGSVVVNCQESNKNWGKIYVSNEEGSDFSLSLKQNPRHRNTCDFSKHKIPGIFIANNYSSLDISSIGHDTETFISYSEGASWKRLLAPNGTQCNTDPCYLNLVGINSDPKYVWFSQIKNPGLIIAIGNTGQYLNPLQTSLNTYISRDVGKSWKMLLPGPHASMTDTTGSILILARINTEINTFYYSFDDGKTLNSCVMTRRFTVKYIVPVPNEKRFLIIGQNGGNSVIISIKFEENALRTCVGYSYPEEANSDFEYWGPSQCINGKRIYYVRRMSNAVCFPPPDADTGIQYGDSNCICTEDDYQCDFCFKWNNNKCVLDPLECPGYDPKRRPDNCKGFWYESSGYRLVPGNTCILEGGVQHPPTKHAC